MAAGPESQLTFFNTGVADLRSCISSENKLDLADIFAIVVKSVKALRTAVVNDVGEASSDFATIQRHAADLISIIKDLLKTTDADALSSLFARFDNGVTDLSATTLTIVEAHPSMSTSSACAVLRDLVNHGRYSRMVRGRSALVDHVRDTGSYGPVAVSLLGEVLRQYKAICTADPGPKWKPGNDIVAELVGDVKGGTQETNAFVQKTASFLIAVGSELGTNVDDLRIEESLLGGSSLRSGPVGDDSSLRRTSGARKKKAKAKAKGKAKGLKLTARKFLNVIKKGDADGVEEMLAAGMDPNSASISGKKTALLVAAAENHPALVSRLLDAGADINHVTADGNFALAAAADAGNAEVVDLLLERGADATLTINGGPVADFASTPAIAAVLRNATGGASGSTGGATAATATATATATPPAPATTLATADEPPATTSTGGDGASTDAAAAVTLSSDLVVGSGAAAGATTNAAGEMVSDVYEACAQGDVMSVQLFLAARASAINEPDSEGRTPLVVAAQGGHTEVVTFLLDQGAAVEGSVGGTSALLGACRSTNGDLVRMLAEERGADVNATDSDGSSAVGAAAEAGNTDALEFLIGKGLDVNAPRADGATPAWVAAAAGEADALKALHGAGADLKTPNNDGVSPFDAAKGGGKMAAIQFLMRKGAGGRGGRRRGR